MEAMLEKNAVVLDARNASKYALRHIKGAVNLQFTDFAAGTLAQIIPSKTTKILIYCNNNFDSSNCLKQLCGFEAILFHWRERPLRR